MTLIFTERDAVPITVMNRHFSVITYMQKSSRAHPTSRNEQQMFHDGTNQAKFIAPSKADI